MKVSLRAGLFLGAGMLTGFSSVATFAQYDMTNPMQTVPASSSFSSQNDPTDIASAPPEGERCYCQVNRVVQGVTNNNDCQAQKNENEASCTFFMNGTTPNCTCMTNSDFLTENAVECTNMTNIFERKTCEYRTIQGTVSSSSISSVSSSVSSVLGTTPTSTGVIGTMCACQESVSLPQDPVGHTVAGYKTQEEANVECANWCQGEADMYIPYDKKATVTSCIATPHNAVDDRQLPKYTCAGSLKITKDQIVSFIPPKTAVEECSKLALPFPAYPRWDSCTPKY